VRSRDGKSQLAGPDVTVRRDGSERYVKVDYGDGQDATSVSVATAPRAIQMKQTPSDSASVSIAAAKETCGAAQNQINKLTHFLLFLARCAIRLQSLFFEVTGLAFLIHPPSATHPRYSLFPGRRPNHSPPWPPTAPRPLPQYWLPSRPCNLM
jgi:hypothetical protein